MLDGIPNGTSVSYRWQPKPNLDVGFFRGTDVWKQMLMEMYVTSYSITVIMALYNYFYMDENVFIWWM